jgi:hypothetical protein
MAVGSAVAGKRGAHDRERAAIVGLALSTLPNEYEVRDLWHRHHRASFPTAPEAIADLADLTSSRRRVSHRALTLRLLAKSARRRGAQHLAGCEVPLQTFLGGDAASRGDGADPEEQVQAVFDGLSATARGADRSWLEFSRVTADALALTDEEVALPLCNDDELVDVDGTSSYRVASWFWSPRPPSAFEHWTDPRRWDVESSLFFDAVTPVEPLAEDAQEFSALFREVVRFTPTKTLDTGLVFTRANHPPEFSSVFFDLPDAPSGGKVVTSDILVDVGSIVVQGNPGGDPARRTRLSTETCIRFADPAMAAWPTLSCDLFWMEFTISAALGPTPQPA